MSTSNGSSSKAAKAVAKLPDDKAPGLFGSKRNFGPGFALVAVAYTVLTYFLAQILAGTIVSLYPLLKHWDATQANTWIQQSVIGQFVYIFFAEGLTLLAIYIFLRAAGITWRSIGLRKPKWRDPAWGLAAVPLYFLSYIIIVTVVHALVPDLNVNQSQQIGFSDVHGFANLTLTFISLVMLPPFVEEIVVRGFLYSSLKKTMPKIAATLVAGVIFASAHLEFGSGAPLLWVAFIDTFVLSLFLVYLREKTDGLWASMTLHASKNLIAFAMLFIFHLS